ncbi:MAG: DUF2183 domain-containing protein [Verrucomicrobiales bacterium]|nr:DUF2183 domain-containing protein [Verrucomicrobiales bacterium]
MWKKIINSIETEIDDVKYGLERLFGLQSPLQIKCYNGYGNDERLHVTGRVLVLADMPETGASDSAWRNFINVSRNWLTDDVPFAKLEARFRDQVIEVVADEEGYFSVEIPFTGDHCGAAVWYQVELRLLDPVAKDDSPVKETAFVQVPCKGSEFGVISDIDDTIIHTGATSLIQMIRNVFLGNAHTRVVFNGLTALYDALARGTDGRGRNPFFYVTSSPWNLYDLIAHIFELRSIPRGTLFMTDWGIDEEKFLISSHHSHKKDAIRKILNTYRELKFVLIGDSGQQDPEIYTDILEEFPGRILAVYIRDVTKDSRAESVKALADRAVKQGVDLVLSEESYIVAEHAVANSLIRKCELPAIYGQQLTDREEAVDEGAPPV